ncbi:hypothetical protein [Pseudomonas guariconensis]|uniref:hypothetical protein n=1 Tax=Pseudomonas guariconensis TaxID=1288410 RepID=UPI0039066C5B
MSQPVHHLAAGAVQHVSPHHGADLALSPAELERKYSRRQQGNHPQFTQDEWREAVNASGVLDGYWEWVALQLQADEPSSAVPACDHILSHTSAGLACIHCDKPAAECR